MVALARQCAKNSSQATDLPDAVPLPPPPPRVTSTPLHRLSPEQITELIEARTAGGQINDLAARFGIHRSTVIAHLNSAGVPGQRYRGKTLTPDQVTGAAALYESGLSLSAVGERFDVDKRQVAKALRGAGVRLRPPGRQPSS